MSNTFGNLRIISPRCQTDAKQKFNIKNETVSSRPRAAFISCQLTCPAATRPNRKPFMVAHEQECQMWKQSLSASTRFIFSIVLQVQFKCARRDPFTWRRLPRRDSSIYCSLYCISTVIVVPCTHGVTNFERLEFGASSFVDVYASRASYTI